MGLCDVAPACEVGHNHIVNASAMKVIDAIETNNTHPHIINGISFEDYLKSDGYKFLWYYILY